MFCYDVWPVRNGTWTTVIYLEGVKQKLGLEVKNQSPELQPSKCSKFVHDFISMRFLSESQILS